MEIRFRKFPIGKKLRVINLLIVTLMTLLTISSMSIFTYGSLQDDYRKDAATLSAMLTPSVYSALQSNNVKSAQHALNALRRIHEVLQAEIYDKSGHLFASYNRDDNRSSPPHSFDRSKYDETAHLGRLTLDNVSPILNEAPGKEQIGTLTIRMDFSEA